MKILITGGTGFVGRSILEDERLEKFQLIVPSRNPKIHREFYRHKKNIKFIYFQQELDYIVRKYKPDVIVNLLGILTENRKAGITYEKVHFEYTKRLVESGVSIKVKKFIQMSALGADINSESRYQRTKGIAEEIVINSGLDYTIFRPSIILDNGQKLYKDLEKLSKISPIIFAPTGKVQPVHLLDVRDCFIKAILDNDKTKNKIYELCGNQILSYKELFEFVLKKINKKRLVIQIPNWVFLPLIPIFNLFPNPPLTYDQYLMLKKPNVCSDKYEGVKNLLGSVNNRF